MTEDNNTQQITRFFDRNDDRTRYIIIAGYTPGEGGIGSSGSHGRSFATVYSREDAEVILAPLMKLHPHYTHFFVLNGKGAFDKLFAFAEGPIPGGYFEVTEEKFFHPTKKPTPEKKAQTRAPGVYSITDKAKKRRRALNAMVESTGVDETIAFLDQVLIDTPKTSHTSPFITKKINEDKEFVLSFAPKTDETGNIPGA